MEVTIELSEKEAKHLMNYCILRGIKGALGVVPDDWDYYSEVLEAANIYEGIRTKIVSELFVIKRGHNMPDNSEMTDVSTQIVRYRCYACSNPGLETTEKVKVALLTKNNTIVCLCDPCEKRFHKEGPFWNKE